MFLAQYRRRNPHCGRRSIGVAYPFASMAPEPEAIGLVKRLALSRLADFSPNWHLLLRAGLRREYPQPCKENIMTDCSRTSRSKKNGATNRSATRGGGATLDTLPLLYPDLAGIDISSVEHYVSVPAERSP